MHSLWCGIDLGNLLANDPLLIAHFSRQSIGRQALFSLERVLGRIPLTEEQLQNIDRRLEALERDCRIENAILADRAIALTTMYGIAQCQSSHRRARNYRDLAYLAIHMKALADLVDQTGPDVLRRVQQLDAQIKSDKSRNRLAKLFMPQVSATHSLPLDFRQQLVNARLALRVCRFRDLHGRWPTGDDDIFDEGLPDVSIGYFSNGPVFYDFEGNSFVISDKAQGSTKLRGLFVVDRLR